MPRSTEYTRRQLLKSAGAALLLHPFLDLLRPARADSVKNPRRLLIFFAPNGTVHKFWRPSGAGTSFTFPKGSILEPLAPHQQSLIVLEGLDFIGVNNHEAGMANMLTGGQGGVSGGKSVDQYVAAAIGKDSRFPSLEFGVQTSAWGGGVQTRMCYSGGGSYVTPEDSPKNAFNRLFGAATGGDAARLLRRRKSTLDLLRAEIADLRGQLGQGERQKLEQHLEALRKTEQSLTATMGACAVPPAPMDISLQPHANFPAIGRAQMDILVAALACDMTRVASIQFSHTVGPQVFSWVNASEGHHDLSHKGDNDAAKFVACERWYAEQFAYLLSALKAAPDPQGGTLLDSTLVVWAKELGDSRLHVCQSVPFVLAGGGGYFPLGRYLVYKGAPHQQLLVSICNAMGLDNQSFGDASRGSGALPMLKGGA